MERSRKIRIDPNTIHITGDHFERISKTLKNISGIHLKPEKMDMIRSRIASRMISLNIGSIDDYLNQLSDSGELTEFCNSLTTNLTSFFRELHHFEHLGVEARNRSINQTDDLRIWSSGCSTGEEPYSIAMTLLASSSKRVQHTSKILATDINTKVLAKAQSGIYPMSRATQIPQENQTRWIEMKNNDEFQIKEILKNKIEFKRLNIVERWPFNGTFDFIFCRNMLIYFEEDLRYEIIERYIEKLRPRGFLYLGHSEILLNLPHNLESLGNTIYRRKN